MKLTDYPNITREWNYEKNGDLKPEDFTHASNKKVWWKCSKCGNEWQATIYHRSNGRSCPICSRKEAAKKLRKKNLIVGTTDLKTLFPNIAAEWDYKKNEDRPEDYSPYSLMKKWWTCPNNHSYQANIASRTKNNTGCPYCSGNKVLKGFNDLVTKIPEIAKEWHPSKNNSKPDMYTEFSTHKAWWLCSKGHEWQAKISNRSRGNNCPICANKQVLKGFNDIETLRPDLLKEWDYDRNTKLPSEYLPGSNKKVYWKCEKGHSYLMPIDRKTYKKPYGCPYCAGKRLWVGYNDLKTLFPEVAEEWDYSKNDSKPEDHIAGTHKSVWWECKDCNHSWKTSIKNRTYGGQGCPNCWHYHKTSLPEQAIYYYVKKYFDDAINSYKPDFLYPMEIDVFIPSLSLGVEYDGKQWHRDKERDRKKSKILKENNISLVRIKENNDNNEFDDFCIIKTEYKENLGHLDACLKELFCFLSNEFKLNIKFDVNVKRDSFEIYKESENIKKKNSLLLSNDPVLKEWNYERNNPITPDKVAYKSKKVFWWKCSKCGKEWQQSIATKVKGGLLCPSCSKTRANNLKALKKIESGQIKSVADYPLLLKERNDERDLNTVPYGSEYKANWKCSVCGNEFKQAVKNRTLQHQGCPICGKKKSALNRRKYKI